MTGYPPSGVSLKTRIIEALANMTRLLKSQGFGGRREPPLPPPPRSGSNFGGPPQPHDEASPPAQDDTEISSEQRPAGRGSPHR